MLGQCRLCQKTKQLRQSHIIPAFVWRWLKSASSGRLRASIQPNVRIQDGPKDYYFCEQCEKRLRDWETPFSRGLFYPAHREPIVDGSRYSYGEWCYGFVVSLAWRVLLHIRETQGFPPFTKMRGVVDDAMREWQMFLLGKTDGTDRFSHHMFLLDAGRSAAGVESPFFAEYSLKTVDYDIPHTEDSVVVFAKIGRIVLFSVVVSEGQWSGTRVEKTDGVALPLSECVVPPSFLNYLSLEADVTEQSTRMLSSVQMKKIAEATRPRRSR